MHLRQVDTPLLDIQKKLDVNDEQVEQLREAIEREEEILYERKTDSQIQKQIKELSAKAGAVGVPLTALYFSGSVVGLSASGITSGLAALGFGGLLGFSSMVTGVGAIVIGGVATYKGLKHITGMKELEDNTQRELMLQNILKNSHKSLNYLIEDVNYIAKRLADELEKSEQVSTMINKLKRQLGMVSQGADKLSSDIDYADKEAIIAKLPSKLDRSRFDELTSKATLQKFRDFIYKAYPEKLTEENNRSKIVYMLDTELTSEELEKARQILDKIGYFDIRSSSVATAKSKAKDMKQKFASRFKRHQGA